MPDTVLLTHDGPLAALKTLADGRVASRSADRLAGEGGASSAPSSFRWPREQANQETKADLRDLSGRFRASCVGTNALQPRSLTGCLLIHCHGTRVITEKKRPCTRATEITSLLLIESGRRRTPSNGHDLRLSRASPARTVARLVSRRFYRIARRCCCRCRLLRLTRLASLDGVCSSCLSDCLGRLGGYVAGRRGSRSERRSRSERAQRWSIVATSCVGRSVERDGANVVR